MADYNFKPSNNISMYPSALRGGTDANNNRTPYNPESRLSSEFNITNPVNRLTIDGSFVISYSSDVIEFSIHGYYFKITGVSSVFSDMTGDIFASIKLQSISQSSGSYSLMSLASWDGDTNLDKLKSGSSDVFNFTGLDFTNKAKTGSNVYSLHILTKKNGTFSVPHDSLLRFDPEDVKIVDGVSLHDVIYRDNTALTIAVDEFRGHLTKEDGYAVKGDVEGNSDTATDASYSAAIGTAKSHPAIGSNVQPVYVDSNGKIQAAKGKTVGGYDRIAYLKDGIITDGAKINIYNRAPINGEDKGQEGDIWFQYVG